MPSSNNKRKPSVVNPKPKILSDAILEGATLSEASRSAGLHVSNACAALRTKAVQSYLAEARAEIEEISTLKRLDVLNLFIEAIGMARIQADPANMINGADKIAKMMGYSAPETKRIELTGDSAVLSSKIRSMSDADLLEMAARKRASEAKIIDGEVVP